MYIRLATTRYEWLQQHNKTLEHCIVIILIHWHHYFSLNTVMESEWIN